VRGREKIIELVNRFKEYELLAISKKELQLAIYDFVTSDRRTAKFVFDLLIASRVLKPRPNGIYIIDYSNLPSLEAPLGWLKPEMKEVTRQEAHAHLKALKRAKPVRGGKSGNK
jgi:hypothetical protein